MNYKALAAALLLASPAAAQVTNTPEIAAKLAAMGQELTREMVGGTMKIYGPLLAAAAAQGGVETTLDQSYGDHERNKLDLYLPEDADGPVPLLVFVHGGGFVRGDKANVAHIGGYFARHGIAAATINYRFAPDNMWPSGAEDIGAALAWLKAHGADHGIDPAKIVIAGNSAGAMHVADYAFREEMQGEDDGVIGAILISPPTVDLNAREIDPARDALYYGTDTDHTERSVVNFLDGRKLPLLIAYAENEPDAIIDQTRLLIDAVATRDGRLPLVASAPGHNHISIVQHIGTADETLGPDLLEFIHLTAARN